MPWLISALIVAALEAVSPRMAASAEERLDAD